MKKIIISIVVILFSLNIINSKITVAIADFIVDSSLLEDNNESVYTDILFDNLYAKVEGKEYSYLLARTIGAEKVINWKIKNEIDAYAVCDNLDLNYVLYGLFTYKDKAFGANVKIYSKKDGRVLKEINYISPSAEKLEFIKETSFKIDTVIYELLTPKNTDTTDKIDKEIDLYQNKKKFKDRVKDFRMYEYLGFYFSTGYAVPFGMWNNLFFGLIDASTGIKFVRLPNIFDNKKSFKVSFRPGFTFSYTLAKNKPEIVEEYQHCFSFRFPAEFLFIFSDKYIVSANFDLHAQVDFFYQNLYNIRKNYYTTAAFGWSLGAGFEYEIDKNGMYTIGFNNFVDFAVYREFYFSYKVQAYFILKFKEYKKDNINIPDIKIKQ